MREINEQEWRNLQIYDILQQKQILNLYISEGGAKQKGQKAYFKETISENSPNFCIKTDGHQIHEAEEAEDFPHVNDS